MNTINPKILQTLSIDKRKSYIDTLEVKLTALENKSLLLLLNKIDNKECLLEIEKLKENLLCLKYGLSYLYHFYDLDRLYSYEEKTNENKWDFTEFDSRLQNKLITYLTLLDRLSFQYYRTCSEVNIDELRVVLYPYSCSNYDWKETYADPINLFIYLLIDNEFKNLKKFLCDDLENNIILDTGISNYSDSNNKLKTFLTSYSIWDFDLKKAVDYDEFEYSIDDFMNEIFKDDIVISDDGYSISNYFGYNDDCIKKYLNL